MVILGVIILGGIGAFFDNKDDSGGGSSTAPTTTADVKPYVTTASALYVAYARNEVAMQDAIGDSPVQITGVIASIDEDFSGSPVLHLEDGDEFAQVGLTLADSEHDKAASLRQGMRVVVICHKMVRIVGSPQGSDCYLPASGD